MATVKQIHIEKLDAGYVLTEDGKRSAVSLNLTLKGKLAEILSEMTGRIARIDVHNMAIEIVVGENVATRYEKELQQSEWISVKDRLPQPCENVLIKCAHNVHVGTIGETGNWKVFYTKGLGIQDQDNPVQYWMGMPAF